MPKLGVILFSTPPSKKVNYLVLYTCLHTSFFLFVLSNLTTICWTLLQFQPPKTKTQKKKNNHSRTVKYTKTDLRTVRQTRSYMVGVE